MDFLPLECIAHICSYVEPDFAQADLRFGGYDTFEDFLIRNFQDPLKALSSTSHLLRDACTIWRSAHPRLRYKLSSMLSDRFIVAKTACIIILCDAVIPRIVSISVTASTCATVLLVCASLCDLRSLSMSVRSPRVRWFQTTFGQPLACSCEFEEFDDDYRQPPDYDLTAAVSFMPSVIGTSDLALSVRDLVLVDPVIRLLGARLRVLRLRSELFTAPLSCQARDFQSLRFLSLHLGYVHCNLGGATIDVGRTFNLSTLQQFSLNVTDYDVLLQSSCSLPSLQYFNGSFDSLVQVGGFSPTILPSFRMAYLMPDTMGNTDTDVSLYLPDHRWVWYRYQVGGFWSGWDSDLSTFDLSSFSTYHPFRSVD